MNHFNRVKVADTLNSLPTPFDTHMVERRYLRQHPIDFAADLLNFRGSKDPLHEFSRQFGQWIDRTFSGQIIKTNKVDSANLVS